MNLKKLSSFWRGKGNEKCGIFRSLALSLCMLTFAGAYAQTGKVTIKLNNAPIKTLFTTIEKQTDYRFSYRDADIAGKQIIPAVIRYTKNLADAINAVVSAGVLDVDVQTDLLKNTSQLLKNTKDALENLKTLSEKAYEMPEGRDKAYFYRRQVIPAMDALRKPVDELEMIVDKEIWPMPSYGDLLFEV